MYKIEIKLWRKSVRRQTVEGAAGTAERTDEFVAELLSLDSPRFYHKRLRTTILTYLFVRDVSQHTKIWQLQWATYNLCYK
jgi:hypothetical protein